jgi:hypothetical protein
MLFLFLCFGLLMKKMEGKCVWFRNKSGKASVCMNEERGMACAGVPPTSRRRS